GIRIQRQQPVQQCRYMLLAHRVHGEQRHAHAQLILLKDGAQVMLETLIASRHLVQVALNLQQRNIVKLHWRFSPACRDAHLSYRLVTNPDGLRLSFSAYRPRPFVGYTFPTASDLPNLRKLTCPAASCWQRY